MDLTSTCTFTGTRHLQNVWRVRFDSEPTTRNGRWAHSTQKMVITVSSFVASVSVHTFLHLMLFLSQTSTVSFGKQSYIINLPSSRSRYELQVRSRVHKVCGESFRWSDWSRPAVWGSNNSTGEINTLQVVKKMKNHWQPIKINLYMYEM